MVEPYGITSKRRPLSGALARAQALADGNSDWMNVTSWLDPDQINDAVWSGAEEDD